MTMAKVKELLDENTIHLEPMRGTMEQVLAYVHKPETSLGNRYTVGDRPKQGNESKWMKLKALVDGGTSTTSLWLDDSTSSTMTHYHKQEAIYRKMKAAIGAEHRPRAILYIWGPTGCGKTSMALDYCRGTPMSTVTVPKKGNRKVYTNRKI